ncbi:MAG: Arm DNA-binding domain-containing protein [Desulfovibrio sp.]|jgi:hypothetical protein|nr:Arm DNA-binding domain-containing protein [Desulfovibrio sp.]
MSQSFSLTDTAVRGAKPTDKPQKLFDGNGLFLFVAPSGVKSWRVKYRFQGREKLLTLVVSRVFRTFGSSKSVRLGTSV